MTDKLVPYRPQPVGRPTTLPEREDAPNEEWPPTVQIIAELIRLTGGVSFHGPLMGGLLDEKPFQVSCRAFGDFVDAQGRTVTEAIRKLALDVRDRMRRKGIVV